MAKGNVIDITKRLKMNRNARSVMSIQASEAWQGYYDDPVINIEREIAVVLIAKDDTRFNRFSISHRQVQVIHDHEPIDWIHFLSTWRMHIYNQIGSNDPDLITQSEQDAFLFFMAAIRGHESWDLIRSEIHGSTQQERVHVVAIIDPDNEDGPESIYLIPGDIEEPFLSEKDINIFTERD